MHPGEGADIVAEDAGQFARGGLAPGAVVVGQQVERGLDPQLLAVDGEGQPGDGLVKEPLPRVADHAQSCRNFSSSSES